MNSKLMNKIDTDVSKIFKIFKNSTAVENIDRIKKFLYYSAEYTTYNDISEVFIGFFENTENVEKNKDFTNKDFTNHHILKCDWKEQFSTSKIADVYQQILKTNPFVYKYDIETNSDTLAILICPVQYTNIEVQEIWKYYYNNGGL